VGGQEDRRASLGQCENLLADGPPSCRIDSSRGLVEHDEIWFVDEHGTETHSTLLPARELLVPDVLDVSEPDVRENCLRLAGSIVQACVVVE
jgi:hypothetical protein